MMLNMKKILTFLIGIITLANSAQVLATNGDRRIGLNATQSGMGGAVVAAPEDAAILFVNPAGIANIGFEKVRLDMGLGILNPPRSINGNESDSNWFLMPTGAANFKLNEQLYLGIGMGAVAGFGNDVADAFNAKQGYQAFVTQREVFQFSTALAYKINPNLILGASINLYNQSLALSTPQFTFPQNRQLGYGATLGLHYKFNERWQMGLSYSSAQNIAKHEFNTSEGRFALNLDGAPSLALGFAFNPIPSLVMEFDIKQIFFNQVRDELAIERPANYQGNVPPEIAFKWESQTVFALGIRKQLNDKTTVRFGLNYGSSPITTNYVDNNLGALAITEKHFAIGLSRQLTENLISNISYTRVFDNELLSPTGNTIKMAQHVLNLQISYHF